MFTFKNVLEESGTYLHAEEESNPLAMMTGILGFNMPISLQDQVKEMVQKREFVGSTPTTGTLEDLIGQKFGHGTVVKIKIKNDKAVFHLQYPPLLTNETMSSTDDFRFTEGITVKLVYNRVRADKWGVKIRKRSQDSRGYGTGGYYHMSSQGCLGGYAEPLQSVADNLMPLSVAFNTVETFLHHRNSRDQAGEWRDYNHGVSTRKSSSEAVFTRMYDIYGDRPVKEYITTWGTMSEAKFADVMQEKFNKWKEQNGFSEKQHTEG